MEWKDAVTTLPMQGCNVVYLVLDETQTIYQDEKATYFWYLVKSVLGNAACNVRVLMFAVYSPGVVYARDGISIGFDASFVLGIDKLNFSHAEVYEYVTKWFKGIVCFERSSSAMETFCAHLEVLTGGHVGLCATAIQSLNGVLNSRGRTGSGLPSPAEWICMLQTGSLDGANDNALFAALTSTRAVKTLQTLSTDELEQLEHIVYGAKSIFDADLVEQYLRQGILVQIERRLEFSSPVMWRLFVKMRVGQSVRARDGVKALPEMIARVMRTIDYDTIRQTISRSLSSAGHIAQSWSSVGHIFRALDGVNTLPEMIARVMRAIDYETIRQTIGTRLPSNMPPERVWQLEFYKAVYRCTPSTFVTCVDVGALFGSSEFIDFTIRGGDKFWGIELLRETSNLVKHIERFSPGGRYSSLGFNEFCLIDFRRVASIDDVVPECIAADLGRCENLFVVCYDKRVAGVVVLNSAMKIVYRMG